MQEIQETQVQSLGWEDPLEKGMATYSSILAWRIPWTEEPGGLVTKSQTLLSARAHTHTHTFLKSVKFVTTLLLFHVLVLWPHGMWHLSSPTRNQTLALCIERWSLNHCTTRESWWVRFDRLQNVSLEYVTKNLVYDITFWLYLEEDRNLMKDFNLNKIKFAFLKRSLCHLKEDTSVTSALIISFW